MIFTQWLESKMDNEKTIWLMRALPGAGKSTLAKQLAGEHGEIFSTDDFFIIDGEYKFDSSKLGQYHKANLERTINAMKHGVNPIVVDNTNVQFFEMRKYVEAALHYGYRVEFAEPNTEWKFDVEELTKKNTHKVPAATIQRMKDRWQHNPTVTDILNSKAPWE